MAISFEQFCDDLLKTDPKVSLMEAMEQYTSIPPASFNEDKFGWIRRDTEIMEHLRAGNKIKAINTLRAKQYTGLLESKQLIESFQAMLYQ